MPGRVKAERLLDGQDGKIVIIGQFVIPGGQQIFPYINRDLKSLSPLYRISSRSFAMPVQVVSKI
jgi:hypothetical protein